MNIRVYLGGRFSATQALLQVNLSVRIAAMFHRQDFDGMRSYGQEQHTVIADPQAKFIARRPELFHVPNAGF